MSEATLHLDSIPPGASNAAVAAHRLSRTLRTALSQKLRQSANISLVEWRILVGISTAGETSQRYLVDFTKAEQAQVSRCLTSLIEKGLILSRRCDDDRRTMRYKHSESGGQLFDRLMPEIAQYNETVDRALNNAELNQFLSFCERIAATASEISNKEETDKMLQQA